MKKKKIFRAKSVSHKAKLSTVRNEYIRQRREQLGLTLKEAATRAGMSTLIQWQKVESGTTTDPQVSTLLRMAAALRLSPASLLRKPAGR